MAQATGYTCDVCRSFETIDPKREGSKPPGWMTLHISTSADVHAQSTMVDLCSNRCVAEYGAARSTAVDDLPLKVVASNPAKAKGAAKARHTRWHVTGDVDPSCEFCQAATSPQDAES